MRTRRPRHALATLFVGTMMLATLTVDAAVNVSPADASCAHGSHTTPPSEIRVARRTGGSHNGAIYQIDTVDFKLYTQRVLPHEWIHTWDSDALKAGAVAVKAFAWHQSIYDTRWWNGQCYHVDDTTNDQVYKTTTYASTNAAVDATWSEIPHKNGAILFGQYRAGSPGMACGSSNNGGTMMRQWGTKTCADQGHDWRSIFGFYYYGVTWLPMNMTFHRSGASAISYGTSDETPITGNWDGGVAHEVGTYREGSATFYQRKSNGATTTIAYGNPGDKPLVGNWDGSALDEIGVYRPSNQTFYKRLSTGGTQSILYGNPGDVPIVGDWDGNGLDDVGVYRPSNATFYLRNPNGSTTTIPYGNGGDVPIVGDWDGNGADEIGVYRPSNATFYKRLSNGSTQSQLYGDPGDTPIIGDWNANNIDDVGIAR